MSGWAIEFQSTLPAWGATVRTNIDICHSAISIHAPRVGSDFAGSTATGDTNLFQSTLPVWGATAFPTLTPGCNTLFQSTLPVWGATPEEPDTGRAESYFNPRSPCGERPNTRTARRNNKRFQSTLPVWGATDHSSGCIEHTFISIHAPRVGSDRKRTPCFLCF